MTHKPLHFHTAGAGVCPDRTAFRGVPMSAEPLSSPASGAFRCSSRWLRSSRKTVLPIPCCPDACSSSVSPPVSAWKKQSFFSGCRLWWLFLELPRQRSGSPETTLSLHLTLFLSLSLTLSLSLSLRHNVQPVCHNVQLRCYKLLPVPEPVPAAFCRAFRMRSAEALSEPVTAPTSGR